MEQSGAPPGDVTRDTMPRLLLLRVLFTLALLSAGAASAAHAAHCEPAVGAELVPATGVSAGAALPGHGVASLATLVEIDSRVTRLAHTSGGARVRTRMSCVHAAQCAGPGTPFSDVGARLLRGGIDSSALGTPPPQS